MYITITGMEYYAGASAVRVGQGLILAKDDHNEYDDEAIRVLTQSRGKCGYVANSVHTVARGTHSAGYIRRLFDQETGCTVRFILNDAVIAELDGVKDNA